MNRQKYLHLKKLQKIRETLFEDHYLKSLYSEEFEDQISDYGRVCNYCKLPFDDYELSDQDIEMLDFQLGITCQNCGRQNRFTLNEKHINFNTNE